MRFISLFAHNHGLFFACIDKMFYKKKSLTAERYIWSRNCVFEVHAGGYQRWSGCSSSRLSHGGCVVSSNGSPLFKNFFFFPLHPITLPDVARKGSKAFLWWHLQTCVWTRITVQIYNTYVIVILSFLLLSAFFGFFLFSSLPHSFTISTINLLLSWKFLLLFTKLIPVSVIKVGDLWRASSK